MRKNDFEFLLQLLKSNAGWQFGEEHYFIIEKKISNFVRSKNYNSVEDLIAELKIGNNHLITQVVEALTFSETMFFRDIEVFANFKNEILPKLQDKCRARKQIEIWSLGCSSGQEAYSLAIIFDKCKKNFNDWQINILGSDLSAVAINKAQRGIYNNFEIQTGMSAADIITYFDKTDEQWVAKENIKKKIEFRRYNMLDELIVSSKFEVVFCRNVLRYFDSENQDKILQRISSCQPQGGYLYLGKGEKIPAVEKYYYPDANNKDVYIAIGSQTTSAGPNSNISVSMPSDSAEVQMPTFTRPKDLM